MQRLPFAFPYQGSESPKMVWDIETEPVEGAAVNDTAEVRELQSLHFKLVNFSLALFYFGLFTG